jgi:hypothetical protein
VTRLATLVGVSRSQMSNFLAGRFGLIGRPRPCLGIIWRQHRRPKRHERLHYLRISAQRGHGKTESEKASGFAVRPSSVTYCHRHRFGTVLHVCCANDRATRSGSTASGEPRWPADRSRTGSVSSDHIEYVRMPPDLLSKRLISLDRYHSVSAIFKGFSPSPILVSAGIVRAIDEDADAGNAAALIVEIWLNEDVGDRSMLGEIWKTELSLIQVIEEGAFE